MKRTEIKQLFANMPADGTVVTVEGWAKTVRDSKNIGFIELNDGSCFKGVQIVFEQAKIENYKEKKPETNILKEVEKLEQKVQEASDAAIAKKEKVIEYVKKN